MVLALTLFREANLFLVVALRAGDIQRAAVRGSEIFPAQGLYSDILSLNR